jgi:hypothetical protein
MFTARAKPIRIIGDPDSQRPDKRNSTVNSFVSFISITIYVSNTHGQPLSKHTFSLTDTATTTMNQLAIFFNNASNDNLTMLLLLLRVACLLGEERNKIAFVIRDAATHPPSGINGVRD